MPIYFYHEYDPYGCFSNFSPHGVELDGHYWKTSEHYYQAQKVIGTPIADQIRNASTPDEAAALGRASTNPLRSDWDQVKGDVMRKVVLLKFETHADIRQILLDTGDELLVEDSPVDYYWGIGKEGTGRNQLGKTLMEVRQILREREGE